MGTQIGTIRYKSGFKHQLTENAIFKTNILGFSVSSRYISLSTNGTITLMQGYAWDGATGVRDSRTNLRNSPAHDAFYQLIRQGFIPQTDRTKIDDWYVWKCMKDGMWRITAYFYSKTLKRLGGRYTTAESIKKINMLTQGGK